MPEDIERRHARITSAADGLHGADKDALEAKAIGQRLERQHQADGAAVGVGHDVATGLLAPALRLKQVQVVRVDFGNDQRNICLHAKGARIRDHSATGCGKFRLQFARDVGVERGKNHARRALRRGWRNRHFGDPGGERSLQLPFHRFAVSFAAGSVAGRKPHDFEPWMLLQQLDEALTDNSGGAKNANLVSVSALS